MSLQSTSETCVSAAQQLGEAKLRYCKIRLMIQLKADNSIPHVRSA